MRAFVTGATGFIGYHVACALQEEGWEVSALARETANTDRLRRRGILIVRGDLLSGDGLAQGMKGCDAVFHVAAHYSLDRRESRLMHEVNVEGTRRILAAARAGDVPRVVFTSSTATVALRADGPADESGFADPDRVPAGYKRSKILAEQEALRAFRGGQDIVVVNPSTPVGAGDVKPTPTGRIILDTIKGRMPAYVDTGLNVVSVRDVAAGHLLACRLGKSGERYILGAHNLAFADLVGQVARLAGRRAPSIRIPYQAALAAAAVDEWLVSPLLRRPARIPLAGVRLSRHPMYFTAQKAVRELGLPQTPVSVALEEAVEWFAGDFVNGRPH